MRDITFDLARFYRAPATLLVLHSIYEDLANVEIQKNFLGSWFPYTEKMQNVLLEVRIPGESRWEFLASGKFQGMEQSKTSKKFKFAISSVNGSTSSLSCHRTSCIARPFSGHVQEMAAA